MRAHRVNAGATARRLVRLGLGLSLLLVAVPAGWANAGSPLDQGRVVVTTALEGLPDQTGDSWARMRHGLALQANLSSRISIIASGQLYYHLGAAGTDSWDESTIQRLSFQYTGRSLSVRAGRFVHVGTLGLTRVDGFKLDLHPEGKFGGHVWAGRVGHAEALSPGGDLGAGAEFRFVPGALGLAAGYNLRGTPVDLSHRIHINSTVRSKKGVSLLVVAELGFSTNDRTGDEADPAVDDEPTEGVDDEVLDPEEDSSDSTLGLRASAQVALPLGTRAKLRIGGRYYGLPPISAPWSSYAIVETIRPTGYGVAEVAVDLRMRNEVWLRFEGGPTLGQKAVGYEVVTVETDEPPAVETGVGIGATGKAAFAWKGLGLYGTGTFVGGAWYAGGGAGLRHDVGPLTLLGEAGLYRFQGLDGSGGTVGEARFQGGIALPVKPTWGELGLVVRTAVGTDRLLSPWWRAGVALQGRLGSARGAL